MDSSIFSPAAGRLTPTPIGPSLATENHHLKLELEATRKQLQEALHERSFVEDMYEDQKDLVSRLQYNQSTLRQKIIDMEEKQKEDTAKAALRLEAIRFENLNLKTHNDDLEEENKSYFYEIVTLKQRKFEVQEQEFDLQEETQFFSIST
jgi:hypothetical protein